MNSKKIRQFRRRNLSEILLAIRNHKTPLVYNLEVEYDNPPDTQQLQDIPNEESPNVLSNAPLCQGQCKETCVVSNCPKYEVSKTKEEESKDSPLCQKQCKSCCVKANCSKYNSVASEPVKQGAQSLCKSKCKSCCVKANCPKYVDMQKDKSKSQTSALQFLESNQNLQATPENLISIAEGCVIQCPHCGKNVLDELMKTCTPGLEAIAPPPIPVYEDRMQGPCNEDVQMSQDYQVSSCSMCRGRFPVSQAQCAFNGTDLGGPDATNFEQIDRNMPSQQPMSCSPQPSCQVKATSQHLTSQRAMMQSPQQQFKALCQALAAHMRAPCQEPPIQISLPCQEQRRSRLRFFCQPLQCEQQQVPLIRTPCQECGHLIDEYLLQQTRNMGRPAQLTALQISGPCQHQCQHSIDPFQQKISGPCQKQTPRVCDVCRIPPPQVCMPRTLQHVYDPCSEQTPTMEVAPQMNATYQQQLSQMGGTCQKQGHHKESPCQQQEPHIGGTCELQAPQSCDPGQQQTTQMVDLCQQQTPQMYETCQLRTQQIYDPCPQQKPPTCQQKDPFQQKNQWQQNESSQQNSPQQTNPCQQQFPQSCDPCQQQAQQVGVSSQQQTQQVGIACQQQGPQFFNPYQPQGPQTVNPNQQQGPQMGTSYQPQGPQNGAPYLPQQQQIVSPNFQQGPQALSTGIDSQMPNINQYTGSPVPYLLASANEAGKYPEIKDYNQAQSTNPTLFKTFNALNNCVCSTQTSPIKLKACSCSAKKYQQAHKKNKKDYKYNQQPYKYDQFNGESATGQSELQLSIYSNYSEILQHTYERKSRKPKSPCQQKRQKQREAFRRKDQGINDDCCLDKQKATTFLYKQPKFLSNDSNCEDFYDCANKRQKNESDCTALDNPKNFHNALKRLTKTSQKLLENFEKALDNKQENNQNRTIILKVKHSYSTIHLHATPGYNREPQSKEKRGSRKKKQLEESMDEVNTTNVSDQ